LKVNKGTWTNIVIQFAIAPFHKPGNSLWFYCFSNVVFSTIKPLLYRQTVPNQTSHFIIFYVGKLSRLD
jgi:hypothetical protein